MRWGLSGSGILFAPQGSSFSTERALPAMLSLLLEPRKPVLA